MTRLLRHGFGLASLLLLLANLVPLIGVIYWGWDAFLLLMLYWMETAIIAFWTYVRITSVPLTTMLAEQSGSATPMASRVVVLIFFMVHSGIFMTVHFVFLWVLFSGAWAQRVHGPVDFARQIVIQSGLWVPLLLMFAVRGFAAISENREWARVLPSNTPGVGAIVGGLYARIVIMHMVVLLGAWVAIAFGSALGPIILLVVLKTLVDVGLFVISDVRARTHNRT